MAYAILDIVEKAVEQLFRARTFRLQGEICTVVYEAVQHANIKQIRTEVIWDRIDEHVDEYVETKKAGKAVNSGMLGLDDFLAPIAP